ncbi:Reelin domain-containing protein 1 [Holothuria leucospilota]|uniref:Reelin domain-containing protein 1 n=1 Tax=Holothuria leucospilota TaxID=206669 RepID=A0A9Q1H086_HOLLE|nr:Reelin domain-containing protein 1 [Holothuria leucospilota]
MYLCRTFTLFYIFILHLRRTAHGYSTGIDISACEDLLPRNHGINSVPQTTPSPFVIEVNPTSYMPGRVMFVTVRSTTPTTMFRGFMLQARVSNSVTPIGTFLPTVGNVPVTYGLFQCNTRDDTAHHIASNPTDLIAVRWRAPNAESRPITFIATVVQDLTTYWVGIESSTVQNGVSPCDSFPCQNNGTCLLSASPNSPDDFRCLCETGFDGPMCSSK